ncbi:hypothetical protein F5Y11DRAFT_351525 [Daldinia sp. FL1419]|nr:hypothetical protein F5Y11DRAFT_351525 [Daldinia sp. FL1419]
MELEQRLIDEQEKLASVRKSDCLRKSISRVSDGFYVSGTPIDQLLAIHDWVGQNRYESIIHLYFAIFEHSSYVTTIQESYRQGYNLMQRASRIDPSPQKTEMEHSQIRIRGQASAQIVLFRCYLAVISDFVYLRSLTQCHTRVKFNLSKAIDECNQLIGLSKEENNILQEAEGHILLSKLIILARHVNDTATSGDSNAEGYAAEKIRLHLSKASVLVVELPLNAHLRKEVDGLERMLAGGAFFPGIPAEEKRAVWKVIAKRINGASNWTMCVWGHPCTLSNEELHVSTEHIKCFECGSPINNGRN